MQTIAVFSGVSRVYSGYISEKTRKTIGNRKCQPDRITSPSVGAPSTSARADLFLRGFQIDVDEEAGVIEESRNGGGDADRAVRNLQKLRHDEGGGAHHRRHELAAGRADRLDRGGLARREAGLRSSSEW